MQNPNTNGWLYDPLPVLPHPIVGQDAQDLLDQSLGALAFFMGEKWVERELARTRGPNYLLIQDRGVPDLLGESALRQFRVNNLAYYLSAAMDMTNRGSLRGFGTYLVDARTRSIEELSAEMRALLHMSLSGARVTLIAPRCGTAKSPDAKISSDGTHVWVEVKSKRDAATRFSETTVARSLDKARSQLPATGPGLVYLQVPAAWPTEGYAPLVLETLVQRWLRNTGRINIVVLMLEKRSSYPGGLTGFTHASYAVANPHPRTPLPHFVSPAFSQTLAPVRRPRTAVVRDGRS